MKSFLSMAILVLMLLTAFACGGDKSVTETPPIVVPDTTKPVITLADPTPAKTIILGATLHLQMDLSDNVELKSYKVTIAKSLKGVVTSDWSFTQTWTIPAGKKTITINHSEITVPLTVTGNQTTTGNYDMTILCTDMAGNENSTTLTIALSK
jgi:hypothetical protein